jgi:hypothetical protein
MFQIFSKVIPSCSPCFLTRVAGFSELQVLFSRSSDHCPSSPERQSKMSLFEKNFNFSAIAYPGRLKFVPHTHLDLLYQITYSKRLADRKSIFQVSPTAQVGSFLSDGFLELGPTEMAQTLSLDSTQRRLSRTKN